MYSGLVHLEMCHFGEKIEPLYNVFHVFIEIVTVFILAELLIKLPFVKHGILHVLR